MKNINTDKVHLLGKTILTVVVIELIFGTISLSIDNRLASLIIGAILIPIITISFSSFLLTLTFAPVAKDNRLIWMLIVMITSNLTALIILFANEYRWLAFKDGFLSGFWEALYFSIVTWTTLGYGDLSPVGLARFFAASEALCGYLIMGLFIAAVTSMVRR